jgi:ribosome biogenesis GTPase
LRRRLNESCCPSTASTQNPQQQADNIGLEKLGWNAAHFITDSPNTTPSYAVARVISVDKGSFIIAGESGYLRAKLAGKYQFMVQTKRAYPIVGDWVYFTHQAQDAFAMIHATLPRRTCLNRVGVTDTGEQQGIAANIDVVFIVVGLDQDYNLRRIERYLSLAFNSGAKPILLLNKADLLTMVDKIDKEIEIQDVVFDVAYHFISTLDPEHMQQLDPYLTAGVTAVLVGSSGVGKSSILNHLASTAVQPVQANREADAKGRHTTTRRELFLLESGAIIIDTPGMRELQVVQAVEPTDHTFRDIVALAEQCLFNDCSHTVEKGCAVLRAVADNVLSNKRLHNYHKLQKEEAYYQSKQNQKAWDARLKDRAHGQLRHRNLHRNKLK